MNILLKVIPIAVSLLVAFFFLFSLSPFELFWLDIRFILTSAMYGHYELSDYLVILLIDKKSEEALGIPVEGKRWRAYDSEIIGLLSGAGARIIVFDVEFSGETTPWDESLSGSYREAGNVIGCEIEEGATLPLFRASLFGVGNATVRLIGGKPRKIDAFPRNSGQRALSFLAAGAYVDSFRREGDSDAFSRAGDEIAELKEFWINYRYPVHFFPVRSYVDVLLSEGGRMADDLRTPLSLVKDKAVLIAKAFEKDKIPLPNTFTGNVYGGFIHAYGIETLLQQSRVVRVPVWTEILFILAVCGVLFLVCSFTGRIMNILLSIMLLVVVFIVQLAVFRGGHDWMFYSPILFCALVYIGVYRFIGRMRLSIEFGNIKKEMRSLEQYNKALMETGKIKDILTDTLVHDIKNAIAAIEGGLAYITEKYKGDSQSLRIFHGASIACTDIINLSSNLLDVRNIEEGVFTLRKEPCSFAMVEEMIRRYILYPLFDEKQITVTIDPPRFTMNFYADTYLFEQMCHNLLSNALKYTPQSGSIRISFRKKDGTTSIVFFNTGKPIPDDQKEQIFEKYLTGGKKRSRYSKGLGLYFCRMAMEMHHGRIFLESSEQGNAFHLVFPSGNGERPGFSDRNE
ncbi:MAG: CHASE2 domain-containing protein [Spirochaetales bacterium]|nr:CHASE2 domain-containing protein [Spirochaetales bacterium]